MNSGHTVKLIEIVTRSSETARRLFPEAERSRARQATFTFLSEKCANSWAFANSNINQTVNIESVTCVAMWSPKSAFKTSNCSIIWKKGKKTLHCCIKQATLIIARINMHSYFFIKMYDFFCSQVKSYTAHHQENLTKVTSVLAADDSKSSRLSGKVDGKRKSAINEGQRRLKLPTYRASGVQGQRGENKRLIISLLMNFK